MSKRKHEEFTTSISPPLYESTPIHDRSSIFIAIFTPSTTSPRSLQRHAPFESASHKILAWRKPSAQKSIAGSFTNNRGVNSAPSTSSSVSASKQGGSNSATSNVLYETGSDEDGEQYAGKKLEKVLTDLNVQGTVVVARWYGGVLLGPVRFKWIEDSAREAVLKWKQSVAGNGEVKKVKVDGIEDETRQREVLIRVLKERDASVVILRNLLAEKNEALRQAQVGENAGDVNKDKDENAIEGEKSKKGLVAAPIDYQPLPLHRLKQMERARDATLAWILKQIDTVEENINATQTTKKEA